jgi:hypothetical protein
MRAVEVVEWNPLVVVKGLLERKREIPEDVCKSSWSLHNLLPMHLQTFFFSPSSSYIKTHGKSFVWIFCLKVGSCFMKYSIYNYTV